MCSQMFTNVPKCDTFFVTRPLLRGHLEQMSHLSHWIPPNIAVGGSVLFQLDKNKNRFPLAYFSKTLQKVEQGWSAIVIVILVVVHVRNVH